MLWLWWYGRVLGPGVGGSHVLADRYSLSALWLSQAYLGTVSNNGSQENRYHAVNLDPLLAALDFAFKQLSRLLASACIA